MSEAAKARWRWQRGEMQRAFVRSLLFQRYLILFFVICFALPIAVAAAVRPGIYLLTYLVIALVLAISIGVTTAAVATYVLKKLPSLGTEISMSIDDSGMTLFVGEGQKLRTWDQFKVLVESRNFYFAQPSDRRGFVPLFPKRALQTSEDEHAFRRLVGSHTKSRLNRQ